MPLNALRGIKDWTDETSTRHSWRINDPHSAIGEAIKVFDGPLPTSRARFYGPRRFNTLNANRTADEVNFSNNNVTERGVCVPRAGAARGSARPRMRLAAPREKGRARCVTARAELITSLEPPRVSAGASCYPADVASAQWISSVKYSLDRRSEWCGATELVI
ncbi:hypothetical protein EVAR_93503_1 [Eumeta japonica]|uniref:Uncharacterized protein n=1 Tax=Eumeta variegata TaxID=151549 RepID=A0A4C1TJG3_EUMVA|nr:hypothetical protein EVAR_93503_1 [Eumeta japonica]